MTLYLVNYYITCLSSTYTPSVLPPPLHYSPSQLIRKVLDFPQYRITSELFMDVLMYESLQVSLFIFVKRPHFV